MQYGHVLGALCDACERYTYVHHVDTMRCACGHHVYAMSAHACAVWMQHGYLMDAPWVSNGCAIAAMCV